MINAIKASTQLLDSRIKNTLRDYHHVDIKRLPNEHHSVGFVTQSSLAELEVGSRAASARDDLDTILGRLVESQPPMDFVDYLTFGLTQTK